MAKKTKTFTADDWITAYKAYLLQFGEFASDIKTLMQFADKPFVEFKTCFDSMEQLETAIIASYFDMALHHLGKDKEFSNHTPKEQHLAFLYILMEMVSEDEIFLDSMSKSKMKDASFILKLQKALSKIEMNWGEMEGWKPEILDKLNLNPKQSILINHSISCILFYLKDKSNEKQDTDAYIEKTTDLLFKLSDTSTLNSMLDLGKFMFSRQKAAFS